MKIEHGDYAFTKAELQSFETASIEDRAIRLLENTIRDYQRLMAAAVQAVTPDELSMALEQIEKRIRK